MSRLEQITEFDKWVRDGEEIGYLIKIKVEESEIERNKTLPPHPLGRIPTRIQILECDVPCIYPGIIVKTSESVVLYFVNEPQTVILRIE